MKYIEYGKENSEVIMMLHGGGLSWWNYRKEAELLCDEYHIILPVIDGHADSGSEFESIETVANKLIEYTTVKTVQYSLNNGSTWTTGTSFSSTTNPTTFKIRVTDADGDIYNFTYSGGRVAQN